MSRLEVLAELAGLLASASGATLAAVTGKALIGVVLGGIALGFVLRLKGRSRGGYSAVQASVPGWVRPTVALASIVEVALLVEATNLPVRFDQPGFQLSHWLLVVLAFLAAYFLQSRAVASVLRRRESDRVA